MHAGWVFTTALGGSADPRHPVQPLQEVVGGELDLLVPPLGRAIDARDQSRTVHAPEVAEAERVARLGPVVRPLGKPEVPGGVLLEGVPGEMGVLSLLQRSGWTIEPIAPRLGTTGRGTDGR